MTERPAFGVYQVEQDALRRQIVAALRADARVVAVWLAGSIGRGTADALSDLDLTIVLHDQAMQAVSERPGEFVAVIREPLLVIEQPANASPGGAYLFTLFAGETGPHQVDWYWLPASTAARPQATRLLFDHVGVPVAARPPTFTEAAAREQLTLLLANFIAMAAIAGKLIARGWTLSAARNLGTVYQLLAEIEWIIAHNTLPEHDDVKERVRDVPVPPAAAAGLSVLADLLDRIETLRPRLVDAGVAWPADAIAQARVFLTLLVQ